LFVSFKRGSVTPEQERALKVALAAASKPLPAGEPLDWFDTKLPRRWRLAGSEREFRWFDLHPPLSKRNLHDPLLVHYATRDEAIQVGKKPCAECNP